ncbi:MAG: signal peptidase II [Eubacteriales bacterium]
MLVWLLIIAGVIGLDQLTKWLTVINLDLKETVPIIENVFHFTYVRNTGAAFSIFNEPDERWIFLTISVVAIIALFFYLWKERNGDKLLCVGMSFILGGGIGNMIDRCLLGYVIDFIDVRLIKFAIFNIADSFVCVGVALFVIAVLRSEIEVMKAEKEKKLAEVTAKAVEENAQNDTEAD